MVNVVTGLTKYALILFLAIYTLLGFRMAGKSEEEREAALWQQNILFLSTMETEYLQSRYGTC